MRRVGVWGNTEITELSIKNVVILTKLFILFENISPTYCLRPQCSQIYFAVFCHIAVCKFIRYFKFYLVDSVVECVVQSIFGGDDFQVSNASCI